MVRIVIVSIVSACLVWGYGSTRGGGGAQSPAGAAIAMIALTYGAMAGLGLITSHGCYEREAMAESLFTVGIVSLAALVTAWLAPASWIAFGLILTVAVALAWSGEFLPADLARGLRRRLAVLTPLAVFITKVVGPTLHGS